MVSSFSRRFHSRHLPQASAWHVLSVGAVAASLAFQPTAAHAVPVTPTGDRLKDLADQLNFRLGVWDSGIHFNADADSRTVAQREYNIFEVGGFGPDMQTSQGTFDYTEVDTMLNTLNAWGKPKVGIYLTVPNQYIPSWWTSAPSNQQESIMNNHINTVVSRYANDIDVWGVCNEALSDTGHQGRYVWSGSMCLSKMGLEPMGLGITNADGSAATMPSYIGKAFTRARANDSSAALIYNDQANGALGERNTEICYDLVRALQAKSYPITGVGFQMHLNVRNADGKLRNNKGDLIDIVGFEQNMERYALLGLDVYITELDVRVPENPTATDLQRQADAYASIVEACLRARRCKAVIMWGIDDGAAWNKQYKPLIFEEGSARTPKPAYYAIQGVLNRFTTNYNLMNNPSFEANQASTQTPTGWSETSTNGTQGAAFTQTGGRTGNYHGTHYSSSPYNVITYQIKTGIPNGLYTARCWIRRQGNQNGCNFYVSLFGGANITVPVPVSSTYQLVEIKNINVTNNQCRINVWSNGNAGDYCYYDDFEFYKQ